MSEINLLIELEKNGNLDQDAIIKIAGDVSTAIHNAKSLHQRGLAIVTFGAEEYPVHMIRQTAGTNYLKSKGYI